MTTKTHADTVEVSVTPAGTNGTHPPSLAELRAARSDFEDVDVPELDRKLRLWALSGTARAAYLARLAGMSRFANLSPEDMSEQSEADIERVLLAQSWLVAGSLGYPVAEWDAVADTLSEAIIDRLFPVAARVSKMQADAVDNEVEALKETPSASSGTD